MGAVGDERIALPVERISEQLARITQADRRPAVIPSPLVIQGWALEYGDVGRGEGAADRRVAKTSLL